MADLRAAPSALERARSALLPLTVLVLGVLTATGLLLVVLYRPPPLPEPIVQRTEPNLAVVALSPLHRVAGQALLVSAAASLLLPLGVHLASAALAGAAAAWLLAASRRGR